MFDYLFRISDIYLFVLLSCFSVFFSILAITVVRYFISAELRHKANPVIGNVSALISLIFGVLAGLTALYLINNISYTADAVLREANAVANIYRDSKWLNEPVRTNIQAQTMSYLKEVINVEWPLMQQDKKIDGEGISIIDSISNELYHYNPANNTGALIIHDMLEEIKSLYNARELRIHTSYSALNLEMWIVILIGTVLTIAINYLFGINFYLHIITVSAAALMASSMVFLLVTLDRPFQGEFAIQPDELQAVLTLIQTDKNKFP